MPKRFLNPTQAWTCRNYRKTSTHTIASNTDGSQDIRGSHVSQTHTDVHVHMKEIRPRPKKMPPSFPWPAPPSVTDPLQHLDLQRNALPHLVGILLDPLCQPRVGCSLSVSLSKWLGTQQRISLPMFQSVLASHWSGQATQFQKEKSQSRRPH